MLLCQNCWILQIKTAQASDISLCSQHQRSPNCGKCISAWTCDHALIMAEYAANTINHTLIEFKHIHSRHAALQKLPRCSLLAAHPLLPANFPQQIYLCHNVHSCHRLETAIDGSSDWVTAHQQFLLMQKWAWPLFTWKHMMYDWFPTCPNGQNQSVIVPLIDN